MTGEIQERCNGMNTDICKEILHRENLTCVIADENDIVLKSDKKAILPMLDILDLYRNHGCRPLYQADKIIGMAAVIIAAECGIREIYADVISEKAIAIAERKGIRVFYDRSVEMILNRTKTAEGPFEAALHGVDENDFPLVLQTIYAVLDKIGIKY